MVVVNDTKSLYPKDSKLGIISWINNKLLKVVDKNKFSNYLSTQWPNDTEHQEIKPEIREQLNSAAKIVEDFDSTKSFGENIGKDAPQYLRASYGEIYGFTYKGKVYLDPRVLDANTPVHEYTHIFDEALQKDNPTLWKQGIELLKRTPLWDEVKNMEQYRDIADDENKLASEVHSRLSGAEGQDYFEQLQDEIDGTNGIFEKAEKIDFLHRLRTWLDRAMQWVKNKVFDKSDMSLEEFVNMPLNDLLSGDEGRGAEEIARSEQAERGRKREGRRLSESEADELLSQMQEYAEVAPVLELTLENWEKEFGKDNRVATPIGEVKLGENQYKKLVKNKRELYFGMIKPTLERPDVIMEKQAPKRGAERNTKFLFVKTFIKPDGTRVVHFESVTVKIDGMEVSISSHEAKKVDIIKEMQNDNVLHLNDKLPFSSEGSLTKAPQREGPDLVPTSDNSNDKGSNVSENAKGKGEKDTRFSIDNKASDLSKELGIDIDTTERGRNDRDKYVIDPQTGKISIVLDNQNSEEDVERSVLTSMVQVHSLRDLFGDRYDTFLDNVYENSSPSVREDIVRLANANNMDFRRATQQYLADVTMERNFDANNEANLV